MHIRSKGLTRGKTKTASKMATLAFRILLGFKDALRTAAKKEHRRIANLVAVEIWVLRKKQRRDCRVERAICYKPPRTAKK